MSDSTAGDTKTTGIIAYLTLIGWIIALVMNNNNKSEYVAFHLRQMIGIMLVALVLSLLSSFLGIYILSIVIQIAIIAFWALGFIGAVQGEKKLVPVLGAQFQEWFKGIG